ncbi:MAG: cytochrome C [Clostridiaceae bacterium]|nr:cytochrome C [Clostridiaceae bacterium]
MKTKFLTSLIVAVVIMLPIGPAIVRSDSMTLSSMEQLGKILFFDENLSLNGNQSCATCHAPAVGYVGPDSEINTHGSVYEGSVSGAFGDRKPPTAAYGGGSPILHFDADEELWIGGMFWDGRATGEKLGDPLADQAQGPFLNPMEQALPNAAAVVAKVRASDYVDLFEAVWGEGSLDDSDEAYDFIGLAIAEYERSAEVNPYTSKYDYYLKGQAKLTGLEKKGLKLFEGKAMCSACHISEPGAQGEPPLFTDFTYDNLGIPTNMENPYVISHPGWIDPGLGGFLINAGYDADIYEPEMGKFKVPTLRNVALKPAIKDVKAYGHNGYFKSLEEIVHFYNTRDVECAEWKGEPWPDPEYPDTMNVDELGNLGLRELEEEALVAFMKTLSDGYIP